jgi:HEAT repeat protein
LSETPASSPRPGTEERSDASVVTQFFILPLLVVAGLVGVFLLFTMATRTPPTPEEHLKALQSGRFNQRWQAAFELSNLLKDRKGEIDGNFGGQLVRVFESSLGNPEEDPRVQRYLALALGDAGWRGAVPALIRASSSSDRETRLYALWSLGQLQAPEASGVLVNALTDKDPAVRSVAAFGLGRLAPPEGLDEVRLLLEDPVAEVRWNAALALARNGDPAGEPVLIQLLDRKYLGEFSSLGPEEQRDLILNALRGLKELKTLDLEDKVQGLATQDPDPAVRKAASSWQAAAGS